MKIVTLLIITVFIVLLILSVIYTKSLFGIYVNVIETFIEKYNKPSRNKILSTNIDLEFPEIKVTDKIPKKIFQTHKDINLIPKYYIDNLKKLNPDYEYIFHDNKDCENFILSNYGKKFLEKMNSFKKGAHKADLWRLCVLYKYGGCYIDADIEMKVPFDKIINNTSQDLIIPATELKINGNRLFNAMIFCKPGNFLIKECLKRIMLIENEYLDSQYHFVLFLMQDIIGNKIKFDLLERYIPKNMINIVPSPKDHFIIFKEDNTIVAKSKRDDFI